MVGKNNSIHSRDGENQQAPYRSGRFYSVKNEWYYSVREKEDQGPFPNKLSAENSLNVYLLDHDQFAAGKVPAKTNKIKLI